MPFNIVSACILLKVLYSFISTTCNDRNVWHVSKEKLWNGSKMFVLVESFTVDQLVISVNGI